MIPGRYKVAGTLRSRQITGVCVSVRLLAIIMSLESRDWHLVAGLAIFRFAEIASRVYQD